MSYLLLSNQAFAKKYAIIKWYDMMYKEITPSAPHFFKDFKDVRTPKQVEQHV